MPARELPAMAAGGPLARAAFGGGCRGTLGRGELNDAAAPVARHTKQTAAIKIPAR